MVVGCFGFVCGYGEGKKMKMKIEGVFVVFVFLVFVVFVVIYVIVWIVEGE